MLFGGGKKSLDNYCFNLAGEDLIPESRLSMDREEIELLKDLKHLEVTRSNMVLELTRDTQRYRLR
jgi:hypothetical protein